MPAQSTSIAAPVSPTIATRARAAELLAPAGGPEPFAAALAAGADAIYCGMGAFNARRKAHNFTDESFAEACRRAHLAGTRVYVTVNIVIKDTEMPEVLELVRHCTELGADAFIIQDWGLFFEIRRLMPQIETHISTQANIHDARGTAWCRDAGADRVTLSRELSVPEIAQISQVGVDLEVFAHGSICFCYSGVCLLSSFACSGRSANRGMCAQPCRLPYELIDERGRNLTPAGRDRALCPRDTNTSEMLPDLLAAGAHALKLEGRMKAPDYVYSIVDVYRRQLDDLAAERTPSAQETRARERQLKRCFNRDFTTAYQQGTSGDEMMSYERSNNRGQVVGTVLGSRPAPGSNARGLARDDRRRRAAIARIRLDEPIGTGDLLELRHDDEFDQFLTTIAREDAPAGATVEVAIPRAMPAGSRVRVIRSQQALDAATAALKRDIARRRAVAVRVVARLDQPFTITLTCADAPRLTATATGFTVEAARTRAVSREDMVEHVGRMGSSPFEAASFDIELEPGCGMGFSAVHKVRAAACAALEEAILREATERAATVHALPSFRATALTADTDRRTTPGPHPAPAPERPAPAVCALVPSLDAAAVARDAGATRIYVPSDALAEAGLSPQDAREAGLIPQLDEVCRAADHERLDPWVLAGGTAAVGNISELALARTRGCAAEIRPCIPVHNVACLRALESHGATGFWLSPELTLEEIERIAPHASAPAGIAVLGRPRVMTSEHCILQVADRCIHDCPSCGLRRRNLALKNIDGKVLPVRTDVHGRSHLYDAYTVDITPQLPRLLAAGVTRFLIDGTIMDEAELARSVQRTVRALDAACAGRKPAARLQGATSGCLFVGIS